MARMAAFLAAFCWLATPLCAAPWPDERREPGLVVRADFSLAACGPLLAEVQAIRGELRRELQLPESHEAVHLFLFEREETYRHYLQKHFPHLPQRTALFVKAGGPGMVFAHRGPDFERDVRHEATHAFLHAALPTVPLWLDEGLAEYFESPAETRRSGGVHLTLVRWNARQGYTPNLARLEQLRDAGQMAAADYRDSWAWIHFLLHGPVEGRRELAAYLRALRQGPPPEFAPRVQRSIPQWAVRFRDHFLRQEIAWRGE